MWKKAEEYLSKDMLLAPIIKKTGTCKIKPVNRGEYFEKLVAVIVGQQLSGKAADTIFSRLVDTLDREVVPEKILKTSETKLRKAGLSGQKTSYVKDLASHVISGKLEIEKLNKLDDEKVIEELVAVKGIGRWTAEMFLMFALARPDVFPVDDLGIRKGMEKLLNKKLTKEEMVGFSQNWKPYRTVASWYVWRVLE